MTLKTTSTAPGSDARVSEEQGARGAARLDELPVGAEAVMGEPDRSTPTVLRLIEMGLKSGVRVRVTRRAPLGDPLEIRLSSGPRLCLRRADARAFSVTAVMP